MPSGPRWSSGRGDGVPANPRAWLVSAGRFKAIDGMRRRKRFDALDELGDEADIAVVDAAEALQPVETAATVRVRNGKASITDQGVEPAVVL